MAAEPLGVLLITGTHERAHYAFVMATGAAALGRPVTLFATNEGCRALLADPASLAGAEREAEVRARGVATLGELRGYAVEFGVRLIACEAGLRMAGLDPAGLLPGVEVAGIATFLETVAGGQIVSL